MVKRKAASKSALPSKRMKTADSAAGTSDAQEGNKVKPLKMTRSARKAAQSAAQLQPESYQSSRIHPLLIDHILDKIFHYAIWPTPTPAGPGRSKSDEASPDTKTVHSIRLVCKQWNDTATKLYRRERHPLSFGILQPFLAKSFDLRMQGFLNTMKNSSLIPVQRYAIGANFFIKQNQRLLKDFMKLCGPTATELRFCFDNTSSMNFTRRVFPDLDLHKLKSLLFNCDTYRGRGFSSQTHEIPYLVEIMLNAAENLQEFRFEIPQKDARWKSGVVKKFAETVCGKLPKSVRFLRLDMPLSDANLNTLVENDVKLEEFQFDCHSSAKMEVLRNFFIHQTSSLKTLKIIDSEPKGSSLSLEFPRLNQLTHMELQGAANIKKFSYSDTFPKLETLNLTEWKTESTLLELLPFSKKAPSVKEVFLPYRFSQAPLVKKVAQGFPNLKSVHISPSPDIAETLQEAFIYFSEIEELYVTFPYLLDNELNVDSLFSGVSEADIRRIVKPKNFDNVSITDVQKKPSITNLKKLKKLVLEDSACDVILTDFSAHFVFLKMDSLSELHTSKFRMSTKYVEMLRNKLTLKLVEDDFSDYSTDDSDGWTSDSSGDNNALQIIPFLVIDRRVLFADW